MKLPLASHWGTYAPGGGGFALFGGLQGPCPVAEIFDCLKGCYFDRLHVAQFGGGPEGSTRVPVISVPSGVTHQLLPVELQFVFVCERMCAQTRVAAKADNSHWHHILE